MPSSSVGWQFAYENVGIETLSQPVGWQFAYENVGFESNSVSDAWQFVYKGDVYIGYPNPKIWFVRPTSGRPLDGIVIYGSGWGPDIGTYSAAVEIKILNTWETASVSGFEIVPAGVHAYDEDREIDVDNGVITMEHHILTMTIPSSAIAPGSKIRVRTSDEV